MTTVKAKCQKCGREYDVFNSNASAKPMFCSMVCELAYKQSRAGRY